MSVIHAPKQPALDLRVLIFPTVLGASMLLLFARLWYFQILRGPELAERAEHLRYSVVPKVAPRGLIFDREGRPIASVKPQMVVTAIPDEIRKHPEVLTKLAQLLGPDVTVAKLQSKLKEARWRPYLSTPIYVGASIEASTRIAESAEELHGIAVESQPTRDYSDTVSLCHVLGRVGIPNKKDIARLKELGLEAAPVTGKDGVERAFESVLVGTPGAERVEIDSKRRPVRVTERSAATPGRQLVLSIDLDLQKFAIELLNNSGYTGAIAAIDPRNGEVLCLASVPTFDQAIFNGRISPEDWDRLRNDPRHPMHNRAIATALQPGSTFKVVTTLAAYESGHFSPDMRFTCTGGMDVGNRYIKCLGHHGSISYQTALAKSCNVYFYNLAKLAGVDALRKAAKELGLGEESGIDIGGDRKGVIPTEEYIQKTRKPARWFLGDTMNFAIGQGLVETTPIQMANMIAQVANNGVRYKPHIVKEIRDASATASHTPVEPSVVSKIDATPEFWGSLHDALHAVVESGTAAGAKLQNESLAGKTGSAEHGSKKDASGHFEKKTHAWFVGYSPVEAPRIALCVLLEDAGHGGDVAAPIARDLLNHYFNVTLKASANRLNSASSASALAESFKSR